MNNVGRNHPAVERVADGLARTGVAVLVPDSRILLEGRLEVGEIDGVVRAFQLLADRPEVDRERVGIFGFSVGGSLALLAAGDDAHRVEVRWVNAFGAFADARTYSHRSRRMRTAAQMEPPWRGPRPRWRARCTCDSCSTRSRTKRTAHAWTTELGAAILAAERPSPEPRA